MENFNDDGEDIGGQFFYDYEFERMNDEELERLYEESLDSYERHEAIMDAIKQEIVRRNNI